MADHRFDYEYTVSRATAAKIAGLTEKTLDSWTKAGLFANEGEGRGHARGYTLPMVFSLRIAATLAKILVPPRELVRLVNARIPHVQALANQKELRIVGYGYADPDKPVRLAVGTPGVHHQGAYIAVDLPDAFAEVFSDFSWKVLEAADPANAPAVACAVQSYRDFLLSVVPRINFALARLEADGRRQAS